MSQKPAFSKLIFSFLKNQYNIEFFLVHCRFSNLLSQTFNFNLINYCFSLTCETHLIIIFSKLFEIYITNLFTMTVLSNWAVMPTFNLTYV